MTSFDPRIIFISTCPTVNKTQEKHLTVGVQYCLLVVQNS